jgi:glutaredoxin
MAVEAMLSALYSRLRGWCGLPPRTNLGHLVFVLYTRRGCHLCEDALRSLQKAQRRYHFPLTILDIDSDADLVRRHGEEVPVVAVNGKIRFRGGVNRALLVRLLEAEAAKLGRNEQH